MDTKYGENLQKMKAKLITNEDCRKHPTFWNLLKFDKYGRDLSEDKGFFLSQTKAPPPEYGIPDLPEDHPEDGSHVELTDEEKEAWICIEGVIDTKTPPIKEHKPSICQGDSGCKF